MTGKEPKATGPRKMPARAGRPRDFGAPESKPSRKVALDEVLRSLQDLVSNELNVEPAPKSKSDKVRHHTAAELPAETQNEAATPPRPETTLEVVNEPPEALAPVMEIELTAPEPPAVAVPPGGLQQELPHLDPDHIASGAPQPEPAPAPTPAVVAQAVEAIDTELPELEIIPAAEAEPAPVPAVSSSDHNHTPTDIPILQDVVEDVEEIEAVALPENDALPALATLPQAVDARKLAIQVAARLNVDLRKAGKPVLSSDVIARLAHALEKALAKAGTNSENDAPK